MTSGVADHVTGAVPGLVEVTGPPMPLMTELMLPEPLIQTPNTSWNCTPGVLGAWKAWRRG